MVLDSLRHPIVLAPLGGGPSTPELTAAVSEAGGLGFLAAAYLPAADVAERLAATRRLTTRPLGVNVFHPVPGPASDDAYRPYVERLRTWAAANGAPEPGTPRFGDDEYEAKIELLASDPPAVASFTFGCPDQSITRRLHDTGSEVWVTVTTPEEAGTAVDAGADALILQGTEAGGHRGSFSDDPDAPVYSLLPLLQLVAAAHPDVPLVASGGITTGAGVAAALCAGAAAVQLGSAFMLCPEAGTAEALRRALAEPGPTRPTRAFTGRTARGIQNAFMDEHGGEAPFAYPEIHYATAPIRQAARAAGDGSRINLWAGEAHQLARALPAGAVVTSLAADARIALARAGQVLSD